MVQDAGESNNRRKCTWALLFIELALAGASVAVAFGQGWEQVSQPLGVLFFFIIATVVALLYEALRTDYEEQSRDHPGTYHDVKT